MSSIKSFTAAISAGLLMLGGLAAATLTANKKFYSDDPIWITPRPAPVTQA
jgi:hypothetical protein